HLVGDGVAVQLRLRLGRPAAGQGDVGVDQERDAAADRVAARLEFPALEVVVPQGRLRHGFDRHLAGRLDFADARRRPQVVADAVGAAEAGGGDDFFVVDALAAVARFVAVGDVTLPRYRAKFAVKGHIRSPKLSDLAAVLARRSGAPCQ